MEHKCSPTTIKVCEILSKWPINSSSANHRSMKPGEKRTGEKRIADRRYAILKEAEKNFLSKKTQNRKSKHARKRRSKALSLAASENMASDSASPTTVEEADSSSCLDIPVSVTEMPNDHVTALIKKNIEMLSTFPSSHFEPPSKSEHITSTTPDLMESKQDSIAEQQTKDNTRHVPKGEQPDAVQSKTVLERFEDCAWEIECTENVKKFLADDKVPKKWKDAIVKKMLQIADGIPCVIEGYVVSFVLEYLE